MAGAGPVLASDLHASAEHHDGGPVLSTCATLVLVSGRKMGIWSKSADVWFVGCARFRTRTAVPALGHASRGHDEKLGRPLWGMRYSGEPVLLFAATAVEPRCLADTPLFSHNTILFTFCGLAFDERSIHTRFAIKEVFQ